MDARAQNYLQKVGASLVLEPGDDPALDATKAEFEEIAHVGGPVRVWAGRRRGYPRLPAWGPEPVFVSFFTRDTPYEALADRLRGTLDRFGLEHDILGVPSLGSWERNCALKAEFVRDRWRALGRPVVWLDADATVDANPLLLRRCGADFAVAKTLGWEIGSGTIFFGATPLAGELLDRWVLRCQADPMVWDQMHLDAAWADVAATRPLITECLPESYLSIFDHPNNPGRVITHWQASREHKATVSGGAARPKPPIPEAFVQARLAGRFTRSPEALFWGVEGVRHIKPEIGVEHPEGFDVPSWLAGLIGDAPVTVEVGCGVGRLASGFAPERYIGVDLNPYALPAARAANPAHDFRLITEEFDYPLADAALFYTVLLHVSDVALPAALARASRAAPTIAIGEIMDRRWRREGDPPVFNRDRTDYVAAMAEIGYRLRSEDRRSYARYADDPPPDGRDTDVTLQIYERKAG